MNTGLVAVAVEGLDQMEVREDPRIGQGSFECPHPDCAVTAEQRWGDLLSNVSLPMGGGVNCITWADWRTSHCMACKQPTFWMGGRLVYPGNALLGPEPHSATPPAIVDLYEEARRVAPRSPRSAAALLRLALQRLIDDLQPGQQGLNTKIGALVSAGLHPDAQRAMDVLRVVGNNAVHPGVVDLDADPALLPGLFAMLNLIVEQVIERPQQVEALYRSLPPTALAAIDQRDGNTA